MFYEPAVLSSQQTCQLFYFTVSFTISHVNRLHINNILFKCNMSEEKAKGNSGTSHRKGKECHIIHCLILKITSCVCNPCFFKVTKLLISFHSHSHLVDHPCYNFSWNEQGWVTWEWVNCITKEQQNDSEYNDKSALEKKEVFGTHISYSYKALLKLECLIAWMNGLKAWCKQIEMSFCCWWWWCWWFHFHYFCGLNLLSNRVLLVLIL